MSVRTRIAPAPSGSIHVGNARTALYNWLFARHNEGSFVLRVEDTDAKRATQEAYEAVLSDLRWLGLDWDEGPEAGGEHGPYRQSERFEHYAKVRDGLLESGNAYRCYCTAEELAERRKAAQSEGRPPGYDGHCRDLSSDEVEAYENEGRAFAIRFMVPTDRTIVFTDAVRGEISTETAQIPDFVVNRSDGSPTYLLAAAVDDAEMGITHIIRGEDLISATPRQLLIREALGETETPVFAHLPLLIDDKRRPLSKRWGDVAVSAYRKQGFLAAAMVNYLALLGWSYDDHTNIFSIEELIERFSLERVARNPAAFDVTKLEWLNQHYIKEMEPGDLAKEMQVFCVDAGVAVEGDEGLATLTKVAPLVSERMKRLTEAPPMVAFLFGPVTLDDKAAKAVSGNEDYLAEAATRLSSLDPWTAGGIEETLRALAEERELKPRKAFQPIRAAITGTLVSPPLFESMELLGKDRTLERMRSV